jgi:hypothetical protein
LAAEVIRHLCRDPLIPPAVLTHVLVEMSLLIDGQQIEPLLTPAPLAMQAQHRRWRQSQ